MAKTRVSIVLIFALILFWKGLSAQDTTVFTLAKCKEIALSNHYEIQDARIVVQLSEEKLKAAEKYWIPSVEAYFNNYFNAYPRNREMDILYEYLYKSELAPTPENPSQNFRKLYTDFSNEMGLETSMLLYNFGAQALREQQRSFEVLTAQFEQQEVQNKVLMKLYEHYFEVLLNQQMLAIAQENVDNLAQLLQQSTRKFEVGVITKFELAQAKQEYNQGLYELAAKKLNLDKTVFLLLNFLQVDVPITQALVKDVLDEASPAAAIFPTDQVDETIQQYAAVQAEKSRLISVQEETKLFKANLKPKLYGYYALGTNFIQRNNSDAVRDPILEQWKNNVINRVGIRLAIPIVNRYADRSMVQQSRYNEERQLNAIAHLENELKGKIHAEIMAYNQTRGMINIAEERIGISKEVFEMSMKAYESGVVNMYDLNKSRVDLFNNEMNLAKLRVENELRKEMLRIYFK